jgi:hypothetical protein
MRKIFSITINTTKGIIIDDIKATDCAAALKEFMQTNRIKSDDVICCMIAPGKSS